MGMHMYMLITVPLTSHYAWTLLSIVISTEETIFVSENFDEI